MKKDEAQTYFLTKLGEKRLTLFLRQWPQFEAKEDVDKWFQELDMKKAGRDPHRPHDY